MRLAFAAIAAMCIFACAMAQKSHLVTPQPTKGKTSVKECCLQGMSSDEKAQVDKMEKSWTKAERAAWNRRCTLCMADPHTALAEMQKQGKQPTDEQVQQHMVSGLTPNQAKAMKEILADKSHQDLVMKMIKNCCAYGMEHAKTPKKSAPKRSGKSG